MLHKLPSPKTKQKSKTLGRGMGSGVGGHTVGRGLKGATARTGYQYPRPGFEGGQNPLSRRLPKYRGFSRRYITSNHAKVTVKLSELALAAQDNKIEDLDLAKIIELGLITPRYNKALLPKVLFDKEINSKINLTGVKVSKSAKAAIEKAGGSGN